MPHSGRIWKDGLRKRIFYTFHGAPRFCLARTSMVTIGIIIKIAPISSQSGRPIVKMIKGELMFR